MLIRDSDVFEATFTEAAAFVRAAELRRECYALHSSIVLGTASEWQRARAAELLRSAPACKEPWFVDKLASEFGVGP